MTAATAVAAKSDSLLLSWIFIVKTPVFRMCLGGCLRKGRFSDQVKGQTRRSRVDYDGFISARDVETKSQFNISSKGRWEALLLTWRYREVPPGAVALIEAFI